MPAKPPRQSKSVVARRPPIHFGSRIDNGQPSPFLSLHEVAAQLRLSVKTILRKMRDGTFVPHIRLGRAILFRRETLNRWMAERETMTGVVPHVRTRRVIAQRKRPRAIHRRD